MGLIGTPGRIDNVEAENSMPLLIREGTSKFFITKMEVCQKLHQTVTKNYHALRLNNSNKRVI